MNIQAFSTSQYDAMREFFLSLGFAADERSVQLCPLFEGGRGCILSAGNIEFNLEESAKPRRADFNLLIEVPDAVDLSVAIKRYNPTAENTLYGKFLNFTSPDGGRVIIQK